MIVSNQYGFSFVHIPKNAGTSLRRVLQRFHDQGGEFNRIWEHPVLGKIQGAHIPLDRLREFFPDVYDTLRKTHSYAIYRDPMERFASSVNHTLRREKRVDQLTEAALVKECDELIAYLETLGDAHPQFDRTLLIRQHVFVFDGDDRVVDELIPILSVKTMLNRLSETVGEPLAIRHKENKSVRFKTSGLSRPIMKANRLSKKLLPRKLHFALRRKAINQLTERDTQTLDIIRSNDRIRSFVEDYYKRDFELARLVTPPMKAAL